MGRDTAQGPVTYTWNARNQLTALTGPNGTASFKYDALDRRIAKHVLSAVEGTVNNQTVGFVFDGAQALAEITGSAITATYLTGLQLDEVLARYAGRGNKTLLTDALGSVIAQANDQQGIQNFYAYTPYGEVQPLGPDDNNPIQYTARENDQTGLYFYRARYYDPVLKRFISEDPIGLRGGANFYLYVYGNPVNYRDPSGKNPLVVIGAIIGGVAGAVQAANSGGGWTGSNAGNILAGTIVGAGTGALAGLVPTTAGPLAALVTGALAGGGGNLASQTVSWGIDKLKNPNSCTPLKLDYRQAGVQAVLGGSAALLGFATGFGYALSIVQNGGTSAAALAAGALANVLTAGSVQIIGNDFIPTTSGEFVP